MMSQEIFHSINPADGEVFDRYAAPTDQALTQALDNAQKAAGEWAEWTLGRRTECFLRIAERLEECIESLAGLAVQEMGKPISQARAEVKKCANLLRHYAEFAESYLKLRELDLGSGRRAVLERAPVGPLLSITPWNFPFWQALRFAVPALAAGNVVVNKPAPNVIGCAQALCELFKEAGVPGAVFQPLALTNAQSAAVIHDERIAGVALTGSEAAGSAVAAEAGRAIKKVVLELGGSDPFIVLNGADIEKAAAAGVASRFSNNGQVCIAAKRFIIEESVFENFCAVFEGEVSRLKLGDPSEDSVSIGPMARSDLQRKLESQRVGLAARGASPMIKGGAQGGPGFYFSPSVWIETDAEGGAGDEETFGPLAVLMCAKDAEAAIARANDTRYGLSASVWSSDLDLAQSVARRLQVGGVFVNEIAASDARLPFGGVKKSGFGRELGAEGVWEFCNLKSMVYAKAG